MHRKELTETFRMISNWKNPLRLHDLYKIKHTTTLISLSDHNILSREWRVILDQGQINYHGRPNGTIVSQV